MTSVNSSNNKEASVYSIRLFGTNNWGEASSINGKGPMSGTGHLYSYDINANATFPAGVTAKTFTGTLSGNASTATKLGTSAGSGTQPVYFSDGKPVATTYALHKTVPSDAKFTDTIYSTGTTNTAGITKLYTGTGTATDGTMTQAAIKSALDGKAASSHGNHVPAIETANNAKFLRNDNTWQIVTPANIGAATSSHTHKEITELKNAIDAFVEISQSEIVEMFDDVTLQPL